MLLAVSRLLAALPLSFAQGTGRLIGRIVYRLPGKYRDRLQANMRQAGYPDTALMRRAAAEAGAMMSEIPKVWLHTDDCLAKTITADETDVVAEAIKEGRGIIYLTPHLGSFEIVARYLLRYGPITVMFRQPRKAILTPLITQTRQMPGLKTVPTNLRGVREFVRALKRGEAIGMLPDQVPGEGDGVWAPMFGRHALTMTLAGKLALQTNAIVMLMAGERLPKGQGWRIHAHRLPDPLPQDPIALATLINQSMETMIRKFPEQYLWGYNRYRSRGNTQSPEENVQ